MIIIAVLSFGGYLIYLKKNEIKLFLIDSKNIIKQEIEDISEKNKIKSHSKNSKDYGDYDPINDNRFALNERNYFNEIAHGSEYGGYSEQLKRWKKNLKIFVLGNKKHYLMVELKRIIKELNELIDPIDLELVQIESEANYKIYFCHKDDYVLVEPESKSLLERNWGYFSINSKGGEILKGTMYVDIVRCLSETGQKHLLREELTQSLGLMRDSHKFSNSIFYQKWSETTEFAPIDRKLIRMLYNYPK